MGKKNWIGKRNVGDSRSKRWLIRNKDIGKRIAS